MDDESSIASIASITGIAAIENWLLNLIGDHADDANKIEIEGVDTFENSRMMTTNKGLVIELADGSEFQITIVQTKHKRE